MSMSLRLSCGWMAVAGLLLCRLGTMAHAAETPSPEVFRAGNLVAWCIVPFDAKKRGPKDRVEMLAKLGFTKYAYDWRAEHLPTFAEELRLLKEHKIELTGVWFPTELNAEAKQLLAAIEQAGLKPQLWVTGGGGPTATPEEHRQRVLAEAARIRPIAEAAARLGCRVGLYNHGGWFGEPENQLAILKEPGLANVGLIYNLHHGHDHLDRFATLLPQMQPYLLCLNLNGMIPQGDKKGQKILPLGAGSEDLKLLQIIAASSYRRPIGILGHTDDDAEERLRDNLDGLAWLLKRLKGEEAAAPQYRTYQPPGQQTLLPGKFGKALQTSRGGVTLPGQPGYRTPPLTLELWAKLPQKAQYNILAANELKSSATHWELFTMAGTGRPTVYLPGYKPDHVATEIDICDDQWHALALIFEPTRVRIYVDGRLAVDREVAFQQGTAVPGEFALGQLVDRGIGCQGLIDDVRLSRGVREIRGIPEGPLTKDDATLGLWPFETPVEQAKAAVGLKGPTEDHWGTKGVGFAWTEEDSVDGRWSQTNVGPFLASIVPLPKLPPVKKGLTIRVGEEQQGSMCFDTEHLQWRAAWTGGFLKFHPARFGLIQSPTVEGTLIYATGEVAGWRIVGHTADLQFRGFQQHGRRVLLKYTIDDVPVLEAPHAWNHDSTVAFQRTILVGASSHELILDLGRATEPWIVTSAGDLFTAHVDRGDRQLYCQMNVPSALKMRLGENGHLELVVPASSSAQHFTVTMAEDRGERAPDFITRAAQVVPENLAGLQQPAPTLWTAVITTQGRRAADDAPYVVDTLPLPFENPYRALLFVTGHDFLPNGDLALCTAHGDVWLVSGVDEQLSKLSWKRFATGLFQPLGLKVVDGAVYVLGRDQITRLIDNNSDGAADDYQCFANGYETSAGGHDYVACLESDSQGRFYFVHANQGVVRVSADGRTCESIGTGLRNPNGLGVGPNDVITAAPQEGEWTPASAIFEVREGGHYGYLGPKITPTRPLGYDPPLCWLPRRVDNSCGGQVWVTSDRWGPLAGQMLHLSFGQCKMFHVLRETLGEISQGAAVTWPLAFDSGVCRGRFSPHDGQLYVSGLKGWVTSAVQDGCLQRVRYMGQPVMQPVAMATYANGLAFTYSTPIARDRLDVNSFRVQRWDYRYAKDYGSAEYSDLVKGIVGRAEVDVRSASVLDDGRTLFLELDPMQPAMQYGITGEVPTTSSYAKLELYASLQRIPDRRIDESQLQRSTPTGGLADDVRRRLQPGLVTTIIAKNGNDLRVDRAAAWLIPANDAPSLRITAGAMQWHAAGWLLVPARDRYRFRVTGNRGVTIALGEQTFSLKPNDTPHDIELARGHHHLELKAQRGEGEDFSLRLLWRSDNFREEPLPPTAVWYDPETPGLAESQRWRHGRWLWSERRCDACHRSEALTQPTGPQLAGIGAAVQPSYLFHWLLEPTALRADATMPRCLPPGSAGRRAAADLTAHLLTLRERPQAASVEPASSSDDLDGSVLYEELGCISCHRWTAPTATDGWNRTSLHYAAGKRSRAELTRFLQTPHERFPLTRMPNFRLSPAEAAALAEFVEKSPRGELSEVPELRDADAGRGRMLFDQYRCGACHTAAVAQPSVMATAWPRQPQAGCLAEAGERTGGLPQFSLSETDRTALQTFLAKPERAQPALASVVTVERGERLIRHLNCRACHSRDGVVSPRGEIVTEESDRGLAPETLPDLTWAGDKLHATWTKSLLGASTFPVTRPWLRARMPAFPGYAAALAEGLAHGHGLSTDPLPSETINLQQAEIGRRLTLAQGGLDCRQCHGLSGLPPTGDERTRLAQGIDFDAIPRRLRSDFYHRFVLDPPRYDVGTRMPKLALDGRTTKVLDIEGGDATRQFDAIWQYLQQLSPAAASPASSN